MSGDLLTEYVAWREQLAAGVGNDTEQLNAAVDLLRRFADAAPPVIGPIPRGGIVVLRADGFDHAATVEFRRQCRDLAGHDQFLVAVMHEHTSVAEVIAGTDVILGPADWGVIRLALETAEKAAWSRSNESQAEAAASVRRKLAR